MTDNDLPRFIQPGDITPEMLKAFDEDTKRLSREIAEQEERERNDPPDRVRIDPGAIFWKIHVVEMWLKGVKEPGIHLSWGWEAGLTEEQKQNMAEDSPRGMGEVILAEDMAIELFNDLKKILDSRKKI